MLSILSVDINENQVTPEKEEATSSPLRDVIDDESELPWAMYRSLDPAYNKNDEEEDWGLDDDENITSNTSCLINCVFL